MINSKYITKMATLSKKIKQLSKNKEHKKETPKAINIVENESSQSFDNVELNLLKNALNLGIQGSWKNPNDGIVHVESAIQYMPESSKGLIRETIKNNIYKKINYDKDLKQVKPVNTQIIKGMREKDVFYLKADKGNKLVILDKTHYFERIKVLIDNGPYVKLTRNPLPKMISEVKKHP